MRYAESNIPVDYWHLTMEKDFSGDKALLNSYINITADFKKVYSEGTAICFAGKHGLGKTLTNCCILKRAVEKGYSGLYINLTDIVTIMTSADTQDRFSARKDLMSVDFLIIDEFDPRYIPSANASDLFGRALEDVFRARIQNKLPLLFCTNSPQALDGFSGPIKQSLSSLMGKVKVIPVLGKDFRSKGNNV